MRWLFVLLPLLLSGCGAISAGQVLGKVSEISEVRIARITAFNNTRLELCLATAREMHAQSMVRMRENGVGDGVALANYAMVFMERCRPELLIERAREVLRDEPQPAEPVTPDPAAHLVRGRSGPPPQS